MGRFTEAIRQANRLRPLPRSIDVVLPDGSEGRVDIRKIYPTPSQALARLHGAIDSTPQTGINVEVRPMITTSAGDEIRVGSGSTKIIDIKDVRPYTGNRFTKYGTSIFRRAGAYEDVLAARKKVAETVRDALVRRALQPAR